MKRCLALALFVVAVSAFAADSRKALVLDTDSKSVAVIDAAAGTVGERVQITDTPTRMILSPDGKRAAVLSRGEGTTSFWTAKFTPTSKSSVTLIDLATMKSIGRTELGWDIGRATFSPDGTTLTVLTPGANDKPAELIRVNATNGQVIKRVTLDRAAETFDVAGTTGAIYFKGDKQKPAEVRLVDLGSMDTVATIPLSKTTGAPVALINDRLYLVDSRDAKPGKAYVISLADRKLAATLDTGDGPLVGAVDPDRGNIYLLNLNQEMRVLNGTTLSAPVAVGKTPLTVRFSDDKKIAYVISPLYVTVVDLTTMKASEPIKTARGLSTDFAVSPDGRRGFVYEAGQGGCCWATVLDLTNNTQMKSFITGSKGARFGQALAAVAASAASYQSGRSAAASHGGGTFYYTVYTPRVAKSARGPVAVRPDGKYAYYLDAQTGYVTLVDGESGERLENIGVGGGAHELVMLANGRYLAAVTDEKVSIIDTDTNQVKTEVKLSGDVADFVLSPKADFAAVIGKGKIAVVDTRTGAQVSTIDAFKRPAQLIFLD